MFRLAGELLPQFRILCGDAHRARVQVALSHHDAANRNQRSRAEAVFLRPQQRCYRDVSTGLQLTIRLQSHSAAQVIHHQRLMSFGDTQFPRQTGMLDAGQR